MFFRVDFYLFNRQRRAQIDLNISNLLITNLDVPQGSHLRPGLICV